MVTAMTEQSGPNDPSERPGSDRQGPARPGAERPAAGRQGTDRSGAGRPGPARPRQGTPGTDLFGELQRWFIRQSAKNMKREISGQVRRSLGGGGRTESSDVWDTATTEIPPEVGESPECQWCPICRAARQMRDSGPGLGGQLTGAGAAVASAVQDAMGALDSLLSKTGATREPGARQDNAPRRSGTGYPAAGATPPAGAGGPSPAPPRPAQSREETQAGPVQGVPRPGVPRPGPADAGGQDPWSAATGPDASDPDGDSGRQGNGTDDRS